MLSLPECWFVLMKVADNNTAALADWDCKVGAGKAPEVQAFGAAEKH